VKSYLQLVLVLLVVFLMTAASAFGVNGPYGVPTEASYKGLSEKEKALYQARLAKLLHHEFVNKSHYKTASFYLHPEGVGEFYRLVDEIHELLPQYSRFVSIGRSGSGLLMFLKGYSSAATDLSDLPFSYADQWTPVSEEQRTALRRHLANNGLTPEKIASAAKPILFFDFVYSGQGSGKILEEIALWAKEQGLSEKVKANLHFYGCFPAETIASTQVMGIYYATLKEGLRPEKPTEKEIEEEAKRVTLPREYAYKEVAGKVIGRRISSRYYNYAGTHGPNGHESLKRELWTTDLAALPDNGFEGQSEDDGHLELYYLRREGERLKGSCPHKLLNSASLPKP